jgi:hypothetical protein
MTPKKDSRERARERAFETAPKITPPMVRFLESLLQDCGFRDRTQRNAYLSGETGRDVRFVDGLTFDEAHRLIGKLEARRTEERARERTAWQRPEE